MTFPELQRALQTDANQGRKGNQRPGRSRQEAIVQPWGRVLVPLQEIYITASLSPYAEIKLPTNENKRGRPPEPVLGPLNDSLEKELKLESSLNLICGSSFFFFLPSFLPFFLPSFLPSLPPFSLSLSLFLFFFLYC